VVPAKARRANKRRAAGIQQLLPLADTESAAPIPVGPKGPPTAAAAALQRLWFCIYLPNLPLEACGAGKEALAVVEDQQGIHRVRLVNAAAGDAGVMPGQAANAALALLPTLQLEERNTLREQQVLESLAAWLEQFSSFIVIAANNALLLEVAGSLRLFGGLPSLRQQVSAGLEQQGFVASLAIAPTPLSATWLARAGRRACIRASENLVPMLRSLPLHCLDWPTTISETLTGVGVSSIGDCLRLPREGFARRFGANRLLELDRALGRLPDPRASWRAPERFCADYEMTEEQSDQELLLATCRELLESHEQFLLVRQLGTQRINFSFFHLKAPATRLSLGCTQAANGFRAPVVQRSAASNAAAFNDAARRTFGSTCGCAVGKWGDKPGRTSAAIRLVFAQSVVHKSQRRIVVCPSRPQAAVVDAAGAGVVACRGGASPAPGPPDAC